jgi:uncharacterized repeat protein (TIGR03803 family)
MEKAGLRPLATNVAANKGGRPMKMLSRAVRIALGSAIIAGCAHISGSPTMLPGAASPFAAAPETGFARLYSFQGVPDGAVPAAGLIAVNGTLYGTTEVGGKGNGGSVFTVSTTGKEHVIYDFGSGGPDGVFPASDFVMMSGTLYGTTSAGGSQGFGTVFKIDKSGNERVLYNFKGGEDGSAPYARLAARGGMLYGTTYTGGGSTMCSQGCGTVFSVTPGGTEHVLHRFKGGSDGAGPLAPVIVVNSTLYGTTGGGKNGTGTIFKTSTSGNEQYCIVSEALSTARSPKRDSSASAVSSTVRRMPAVRISTARCTLHRRRRAASTCSTISRAAATAQIRKPVSSHTKVSYTVPLPEAAPPAVEPYSA